MTEYHSHQCEYLIDRRANDDTDGWLVELVRTQNETKLRAATGEAPVIEEKETRRYFDREHRPCPKTGPWAYMKLTTTWLAEAPPDTPKT